MKETRLWDDDRKLCHRLRTHALEDWMGTLWSRLLERKLFARVVRICTLRNLSEEGKPS